MRNYDSGEILKRRIDCVIVIAHPDGRGVGEKSRNNGIGVGFWSRTLGIKDVGEYES
jgi:hypothetical protein